MTDFIYDYAYANIISHVKRNSLASACDSKSENVVNTDDFSPKDLQLFVDSMETITRLERAKHDRRQQLKIKSHQQSQKIISCLDSSTASPTANSFNEDAKGSLASESGFIHDETYYYTPYQAQSSASYIDPYPSRSSLLDSEESGVFLHTTEHSNFYEDIDIDVEPIRSRSKVISHPKSKSLKSRLISLIMKKQYVQPSAPIADILSSTTYGEEMEVSEIYDRVLDDVIKQQFVKNPKKPKKMSGEMSNKKPASINPEEKFLDKAMSFLAL